MWHTSNTNATDMHTDSLFYSHYTSQHVCLQCFDAVGWAAGRASRLQKKQTGGVWLSVCSKVQTCIWTSWCYCHSLSLSSVKSRLVLPFWYWLTWLVPEKGPLNGCVCIHVNMCQSAGTPRWEMENFVTAKFYCPQWPCSRQLVHSGLKREYQSSDQWSYWHYLQI